MRRSRAVLRVAAVAGVVVGNGLDALAHLFSVTTIGIAVALSDTRLSAALFTGRVPVRGQASRRRVDRSRARA